jgi:hypothetical protein
MRFRRPHPRTERLSDLRARLAEAVAGSVASGELPSAVGERSFGALLVILALPNRIAGVIPGLSILLASSRQRVCFRSGSRCSSATASWPLPRSASSA